MNRSIRSMTTAVLAVTVTLAAMPAHAAFFDFFDSTLPWNVWLGIASGLMLVVGLVLAAASRPEDADVYRFDAPRRTEPMPLYEEGASA